MRIIVVSLILFISGCQEVTANQKTVSPEKPMFMEQDMTYQLNSILPIPDDYLLVNQQDVIVNDTPASLFRYQPESNSEYGLMDEHFSYISDKDGMLKGFVNLSEKISDSDSLPSKDESKQVAFDFLKTYAPDLLDNMEVHWVKPHDETIYVKTGNTTKEVVITGMKVKCRNLNDGLWFWVIVNHEKQAYIFERDIEWINFPGKRKTEKWLHDQWLSKHL